MACFADRPFLEQLGVFCAHVLHVLQPVVGKADAPVHERRADPRAAVVADDHDVLDPEQIDGELNDGKAVQVGMYDDVRDVAVDEHFAGRQADDLVRGDARIGAADPEILGRLLVREAREVLGIFR